MQHYGEDFRTNRRYMKKALGPNAVQGYVPVIERQCIILLADMERDPDQFVLNFRK